VYENHVERVSKMANLQASRRPGGIASILLDISILYSETSTVCRNVGNELSKDAAWYLEGVDTWPRYKTCNKTTAYSSVQINCGARKVQTDRLDLAKPSFKQNTCNSTNYLITYISVNTTIN